MGTGKQQLLDGDAGYKACGHCGMVWRPRRRDAKYHSARCRLTAYRAKKRGEK